MIETINTLDNPTAEEINKHFSAMQDSVNIINTLAFKDSLTEDDQATISRNKEHLVIMLAKDFIADDSRDKSVFVSASQ